MSWAKEWFNEDYLKLYANRNAEEAQNQVDFLIRALSLSGKERILDIGCGTGRHSIAFGKKGYRTVGIDISPFLLGEARRQLLTMPSLPVTFFEKDMHKPLELGFFDLIICMFTTFGYDDTDEENALLFENVRNTLTQGGQFFLDYLHPSEVLRHFKPYEEKWVNHQKVEIRKEIMNDTIIKTIQFPDKQYLEKVKLYSKEKVVEMLTAHHLHVEHIWNDYSGNTWRPDGDRQLFHAVTV